MKKGFELWPHDKSVTFIVVLVLSLSEADAITKKWGCEWGIFHPGSARGFKMVFKLLTEVVVFYMELIPISFQAFSIKWSFLRLLFPSLGWFHECFYKFQEYILSRKKNKKWSKSLKKNKSPIATGIRSFCLALASKLILLYRFG